MKIFLTYLNRPTKAITYHINVNHTSYSSTYRGHSLAKVTAKSYLDRKETFKQLAWERHKYGKGNAYQRFLSNLRR